MGRFFVLNVSEKLPPYTHVQFHGDSAVLVYVDSQQMGRFRVDDFDFKKRGPDPVLDHRAFCQNVASALSKAALQKPLGEVLLNQAYFNGIGNYMRAEIVHRTGVDPRTPASVFFSELPQLLSAYEPSLINTSSPSPLILLYLCGAVTVEVLERGLNKYGNASEVKLFNSWLKVYGKGDILTLGGRKFYWNPTPISPDLPVLLGSGSFCFVP